MTCCHIAQSIDVYSMYVDEGSSLYVSLCIYQLYLKHIKQRYSLAYYSNAPRSLKDRWMQADKHTDMCACMRTWKSPCNSCNILQRTAIPHYLGDDARTQSSENENLPVVVVVIVTCMHAHSLRHTHTHMQSQAHV